MSTLLVVAFAITLFALPSAASAFNVANFDYKNYAEPNSTIAGTQAASHPSVTVSFNRQGSDSEDLKDAVLTLPKGVFANPEAVASKCSNSQFTSDNCPSASTVGTMSVTVKALGLLDLTIPGSIDIVNPGPNDAATLGLTLRPAKLCILWVFCAQPEKIYLKTGAIIDTYNDAVLKTTTPTAPTSATIGIPLVFVTPTIPADITVNSMTLSFQSRTGEWGSHKECTRVWFYTSCKTIADPPSGDYFWLQTSSCEPSTASVKLVSYGGATSSASKTFTPTGCNNVPFNPSFSMTPQSTDSNVGSPVDFDFTIPAASASIQNSLASNVDVDFPAGSGLDLNALSGVTNCTETQLQAKACPASSQIGTAYAFSDSLPGSPASQPGLVGKVFAMSVSTQINLAVQLYGPRNTVIVFRGYMGARNGGTFATFDEIPQVPYSKFALTLDKPVYKNPATCGAKTSVSTVTAFSGAVAHPTSGYTVGNCSAPPQTTITDGPPSTTVNTHPAFTFESDQAGSTFQCSMDNAAFTPCATPYESQPLSNGSHTFQVKALKGTVEDPTPASYTFTVATTGFTITAGIAASTTQAVAHPNVDATFDLTGGQPKEIALKMPTGFAASLAAVTPCDASVAAVGACASASTVGSATLTVDTFSGPETKTGNLYLTDGPSADDAGGIALAIVFNDGTFISTGGAYIVGNGTNQYLELRNIPSQIGGSDVTITKLVISMSGANGFLTNPSNCEPSEWAASATDYDGNDAPAFAVPFQADGCASVPFGPTLTQTLGSPSAGSVTGATAHLDMPTDNSAIQVLQVDEPRVIKPNFPAFGQPSDQCPASAAPDESSVFDPSSCPAQALVGSMEIDTPLLPDPLVGKVYLIEKSPIPWLGVAFDAPGIHVRFTGVTSTPKVNPSCPSFTPGGCPTRISILFNYIPDVQIRSIDLDLDGPDRAGIAGPLSGKILQLASASDPACNPSSVASSTFVSHSDPGNPFVQDQTIAISGCN